MVESSSSNTRCTRFNRCNIFKSNRRSLFGTEKLFNISEREREREREVHFMTKRPRAADNVSARTHESCVNYARVQQDEKFQTSEIVETLAESRESVENLKF